MNISFKTLATGRTPRRQCGRSMCYRPNGEAGTRMVGFYAYEFAAPALRDLVCSAWSVAYGADEDAMPGIIAPDAHVELVFQTGEPCGLDLSGKIFKTSPRAMLFALRRGALKLHARGANTIAALRLSPAVASVLLGRPLNDVWNAPVDLRDVIGPEIDTLVDRVAHTPQAAIGEVLEAWLTSRLANWDAADARSLHLQHALFWQFTDNRVSALAGDLGVTERTLRRHCERYAGLSPKQVSLSGRVLRACVALRDRRDMSISEVASSVGFYDQAAFTNTFHHVVTMTPRAFRAAPMVYCEGARS